MTAVPSLVHAKVGDRFHLVKPAIGTEQLVRYAGASDDYNRIHYDLPYAQAAGLGGVIAHGMLTMGFMAQALTDWGGPRVFVQQFDARFQAPVRPGDSVEVEVFVLDLRRAAQRLEVRCELRASVGGRAVAHGHATVRCSARGTASDAGGASR